MSELTEFLLARIAEDEAAARAAQPKVWYSYFRNVMVLDDETVGTEDEFVCQVATKGDARHIARHDPARVLAECEAKRRIVALHADGDDHECAGSSGGRPMTVYEGDCPTLRVLASVYANHAEFRAEWAL